ncbi:MAG: hypothetical protein INR64_15920 [Caulobacteraceae bacterium]|nr:hypothetical protein [Caulobacter sp.]
MSRAGLLPVVSIVALAAGDLPAAAQFSGVTEQFNDMRTSLGFGPARPPMDFTERPPLVVPPNDTLPPPGSGTLSLGVNDTDVNNRRKAMSDSRRPVPPSDPGSAATGLSSRAYLIDPPSGLRDPATLGPEPSVAGKAAVVEKPAHRRRARRRVPAPMTASQ